MCFCGLVDEIQGEREVVVRGDDDEVGLVDDIGGGGRRGKGEEAAVVGASEDEDFAVEGEGAGGREGVEAGFGAGVGDWCGGLLLVV